MLTRSVLEFYVLAVSFTFQAICPTCHDSLTCTQVPGWAFKQPFWTTQIHLPSPQPLEPEFWIRRKEVAPHIQTVPYQKPFQGRLHEKVLWGWIHNIETWSCENLYSNIKIRQQNKLASKDFKKEENEEEENWYTGVKWHERWRALAHDGFWSSF